MSITGGNGGFVNSFKTRQLRHKGETVKSRLEQREAALQKQRKAFLVRALAPSSKKAGEE